VVSTDGSGSVLNTSGAGCAKYNSTIPHVASKNTIIIMIVSIFIVVFLLAIGESNSRIKTIYQILFVL
jgi:hypothetical protein